MVCRTGIPMKDDDRAFDIPDFDRADKTAIVFLGGPKPEVIGGQFFLGRYGSSRIIKHMILQVAAKEGHDQSAENAYLPYRS